MSFRALVFSKSSEANTAIAAACASAGIVAEICPDIFTAIEKGKTQAFSCVIVDWDDQPEASFLLKRARESEPNRETLAVAIVDHDPKPAETRDSRLDFLIFRPVSAIDATGVLAKAREKMKPVSAEQRTLRRRTPKRRGPKRAVSSEEASAAGSGDSENVADSMAPDAAREMEPGVDDVPAQVMRSRKRGAAVRRSDCGEFVPQRWGLRQPYSCGRLGEPFIRSRKAATVGSRFCGNRWRRSLAGTTAGSPRLRQPTAKRNPPRMPPRTQAPIRRRCLCAWRPASPRFPRVACLCLKLPISRFPSRSSSDERLRRCTWNGRRFRKACEIPR